MGIGKTLTTLRKNRGLSQGEVAKELNVSRQTISLWESDKADPLLKKFVELADLLMVSPNTMLGIGISPEDAKTAGLIPEQLVIQRLDIEACCGSSGTMANETPQALSIRVNPSWFNKNLLSHNPKDIKIITATGDSMSPLIDDGDLVFIDISQDALNREGIFFLIYDDQYFIKRVQRVGGGKLLLLCDNPKYRDMQIESDSQLQFKVVGRVVLNLKPEEFK